MSKPKVVITFGSFDLLHVGHVKILKRARELGDRLVVGVSSDKFHLQKKFRKAIYSQGERKEILASLSFVDEVFLEESFEEKEAYILKYHADILVMGDDWKGRFDSVNCKVIYLPRTPSISTTEIIEKIVTKN